MHVHWTPSELILSLVQIESKDTKKHGFIRDPNASNHYQSTSLANHENHYATILSGLACRLQISWSKASERKHKTNKEKQNKKLGTSEVKTSTLSKSNSIFLLGYTSVLMTNTCLGQMISFIFRPCYSCWVRVYVTQSLFSSLINRRVSTFGASKDRLPHIA